MTLLRTMIVVVDEVVEEKKMSAVKSTSDDNQIRTTGHETVKILLLYFTG
jgi:hypothetical protein